MHESSGARVGAREQCMRVAHESKIDMRVEVHEMGA